MEIILWIVRLFTRHKRIQLCWAPAHVNVAGNERADEMAREASTSNRGIHIRSLPNKDYYLIITEKFMKKWSIEWRDTNKLRAIKDDIMPWPSASRRSRRDEIILCRLRIRYTRLTHRHLIERDQPTYCDDYLVPVIVVHMLAECH